MKLTLKDWFLVELSFEQALDQMVKHSLGVLQLDDDTLGYFLPLASAFLQ
jgi:hypothetical protein